MIERLLQSGTVHLPDAGAPNPPRCAQRLLRHYVQPHRSEVFLQRRLDLQKTDLENELRSNGNTITATRLSGSVSNALLAGEQNYEWVNNLLDRFQNGSGILATDTPREVYKVNRAHLLFYRNSLSGSCQRTGRLRLVWPH